MATFTYSRAICRAIPKSLVESAIRIDNSSQVDYDLAVKQHNNYVETLRKLGLKVTVLPAIESLPDCVFVEDPAIVIDKKAVITNLGHPNRKAEATSIMEALKELDIEITVMTDPATVDGGDVLFTGREIFVGLSTRSNEEGVAMLQNVFPEYPVHGIKVEEALHLKSCMSMCAVDTLLVGSSGHAEKALNDMLQKAKFKYKQIRIPDDFAANCLFINGTVVHRAMSEFPKSTEILKQFSHAGIQLEAGELEKVDGALTCCSLLLK